MNRFRSWLALVVVTLAACSSGVLTSPEFDPDVDVTILFVGNSLTYVHDVPGLVRQLGAQHDVSIGTLTIAHPNFSLEDHWYTGLADHIRRLRADFVVMQQGPSSLPQNRAHLVHWSEQLAAVIREAGGEPALYMVWPDISRRAAFPEVETSYAEAARAVNGPLLPAGTTWLRAWDQDEDLQLYAADGLHASYIGALAAAQTIFAGLFDVDPATLASLGGGVSTEHLDVLRAAVASSLEQWEPSAGRAAGTNAASPGR